MTSMPEAVYKAMSALGHKPTYALQQAMSALHPIATLIAYFHGAVRPYISGMVLRSFGRGRPLNAPASSIRVSQAAAEREAGYSAWGQCWFSASPFYAKKIPPPKLSPIAFPSGKAAGGTNSEKFVARCDNAAVCQRSVRLQWD